MNYAQALYPLLEPPPPPPAPGGIAIPTVGTLLNFIRRSTAACSRAWLRWQSPVTAPPLGYGRLAMFGESGAQMSALHAYDTYQGDLWPYSAHRQRPGGRDAGRHRQHGVFCTGQETWSRWT